MKLLVVHVRHQVGLVQCTKRAELLLLDVHRQGLVLVQRRKLVFTRLAPPHRLGLGGLLLLLLLLGVVLVAVGSPALLAAVWLQSGQVIHAEGGALETSRPAQPRRGLRSDHDLLLIQLVVQSVVRPGEFPADPAPRRVEHWVPQSPHQLGFLGAQHGVHVAVIEQKVRKPGARVADENLVV